jgi:hypothetical protein
MDMTPLAFLFGTPLAASAALAGAVVVPIIIHLLNRRRYRVVVWAAMRFLLAAEKKNARRMRIEQLLLLAVRTSLVLLLVLAMASVMPWSEKIWHALFPESMARAASFATQRTHKILILDGSFSMATRVGDATCFDRARSVAEQIVRHAPAGDGFSVVLMSAPPRRVVPEPSEDAGKVLAELGGLRLPHGNADLAATLNTVENLVRQSPAKFDQREVYFISDLQSSTWLSRQPGGVAAIVQKIQERTRTTVLVDVGADGISNTAVTSLTLGVPLASVGSSTPITATIHNFGPTVREQARVELLVGKARATAADPPVKLSTEAQKIERLHRGPNIVTFTYPFKTPGEYVVQVRVEPDALEVDDARSFVVSVKKDVPVMLVNGKPAVEAFDRATEWLRLALKPDDSPIPGVVPARLKVVSVKEFNDAGLGDLSTYDCVFFCSVPSFTPAEVQRIKLHLRGGGGAVFALGDKIDLGVYNELLYDNGAGLLPARLIKEQPRPSNSFFHFVVDEKDYREPPLDSFVSFGDRLSLTSARFRQYVSTELASHGQPRKVLAFMPEANKERGAGGQEAARLPRGEPALIEWQPLLPPSPERAASSARYRGRVILFTSTLNMDWNSWPASPSYPAFVQELLRYAVAGRLREQAATVGESLETFVSSRSGLEVTLRTPGDARPLEFRTEAQDAESVLRWADTDQSGIYVGTIGSDPAEHVFAVNVPTATENQQASESDLTRTSIDELKRTYPEWELQVVTDLGDVVHSGGAPGSDPNLILRPLGPAVAHWLLLGVLALLLAEVVLAWHFGHYSSVVGGFDVPPATGRMLPLLSGALAFLLTGAVALVLAHAAWTGDFFGFLPDAFRRSVEQALNIPAPAPGEGSRWRLEFSPYLLDAASDPWLAGGIALAGLALVVWIYAREGRTASSVYRVLLAGLRVCLLLLMLAVLLPQLKLWFERQGWPDLAIIIDDSASMSTTDRYRDPQVQAAAEKLSSVADLPGPERLALAQALLSRDNPDWLNTLLTQRKVKVHIYHCSTRAHRISDITEREDLKSTSQAIRDLRADSKNDSSQLGGAVRQALNDFRGSSLSAVVMLTDGVTTEGEDLVKVSKYAAQLGVPLFFVGIGDSHEIRDLALHDVQVDEAVYVNDRVVFEARLTGHGFGDLEVPVQLFEKGKEGGKPLKEERVKVDPQGKEVKVRLVYQPTEPGDKAFVIRVPVQGDEPPDNNRLERRVLVREAKIHKVLYIEQYPRWEYRYIKSLLERESAQIRGNKAIDLRVLLLEADSDYASQDRSALVDFPTRAELNQFDVVILGDVDPKWTTRMTNHLQEIADFVRQRGGGLLMIAGERYAPRVYKESPLKDVLPIDLTSAPAEEQNDRERVRGYRPELTPIGRLHPIFRFTPDENQNDEIWNRLREMYWYAEGYQAKRAAEVLAVLPIGEGGEGDAVAAKERHPLVLQQFVGAGRSMFFGFNETWRWRFREDELRFNQFWVQAIRYLAVGRLGRVDLKVDRQVPYRRGEPIKITVRFPDDAPAPPQGTEVKVLVERRPPRAPGQAESVKTTPVEVQTVQLRWLEGSRATYEQTLTRTPEGEYTFTLTAPVVQGAKPSFECRVLAPPGEMDQLQMNQADMEKAAQESHGKFYTFADADRLLDELPAGVRVTLNAPGPPALLWNHTFVFLIALGLLSLEWVLRKRKHLL